jgi:transposase
MGRKSDLSPRKRGQIQMLLQNTKLSQAKIADKLFVSQRVVSNIKQTIEQGETLSPKRKGRCGRKRITSPQDDRVIVKMSRSNRKMHSKKIAIEMADRGVNVSSSLVRRRLISAGYRAYRPRRKPKLTPAMRLKRLNWAKAFINWTAEDWERVCFSDESTIQILDDRCQYVRRRPGEEFLPECIVDTVKHPDKIMIWSVISVHGPGRLYKVDGNMNGEQYKKVMETRLIPQLREWYPDGNCVFMQDGAPCHRANLIMNMFEDIGMEVLPWPGNSPDLNPIEGIWHTLKGKVHDITCTNKVVLLERIIRVWHHDEQIPELISKCIRGMPDRIKAVIKAKGGPTKY